MKKGQYLNAILRSQNTVFNLNDIAILWREASGPDAHNRLKYYLDQHQLVRLRNGLYAKNQHYEKLELATKILTPAYISFETVLAKSGFIFQYYRDIFVATYLTREIQFDNFNVNFRKIKSDVLTNPLGIDHQNNYAIATPERAFLDTLYLNKDFYFDNLSTLDWDKAFELLPIYNNKRLIKTVYQLHKQFKEDNK